MQPEKRDLAYLRDMRHAANEIIEFMVGIGFEEFKQDNKLRMR